MIEFIDHVAITVADIDRTIEFYERVLGADLLYADQWRAGAMPVALLQVGGSRLSVHPVAAPVSPHADRPTAGSVDICFRWKGSVEGILTLLAAHGVAVVEGPIGRPASDGSRATSVYFRDPDANLLELLTVEP